MHDIRLMVWAHLPSLLLLPALVLSSCAEASRKSSLPPTVSVGALLSSTGDRTTLGQTSRAALTIAGAVVADEQPVRLVFEDTRLDPELARQKLDAMAAQGIRLVIGPPSSAELVVLKPIADARGILLVSPTSTAGSLAVPGDNVLRLGMSDRAEGQALASRMRADGIEVVVPIWRGGTDNQQRQAALRQAFEAAGGEVSAGVAYGPDDVRYGPEVAELRRQVGAAIRRVGSARVGVYLAGFEEGAEILAGAAQEPWLGEVRWYGGGGLAKSQAVLDHPLAGRFAAAVGLTCPSAGLDEAGRSRWEPVVAQIEARTGLSPDGSALAAYDALVIGAKAIKQAGTGDAGRLREGLIAEAARHHGLTGPTALDAAGDRVDGTHDWWAVRDVAGTLRWTRGG